MLPPKEHLNWKQLLYGRLNHEFACVPAGLMLSRIRRQLGHDGSEANYDRLFAEVYAFFTKYETILEKDVKAIFTKEV